MDIRIQIYNDSFLQMYNKVNKKNVQDVLVLLTEFAEIIRQIVHKELAPNHLDKPENEKQIREICMYCDTCIYSKLENLKTFISEDNDIVMKLWERVEDDFLSIMAFRSIKSFAYYIDRDKPKKKRVWEKTMPIFENLFYYINKMILSDNVDLIRASYFPGAGKSYAGNLAIAYWLGYDKQMSFLRITYNDDLTKGFVKAISLIIKSKRFKKVFPEFDLPDKDLFEVNNAVSFQLKGSAQANLVGSTCDGRGTGFRAKVLMLDDVIKGVTDAYNIALMKKILNQFDNEWTSRADDDNQKLILLGTMWSCYDILNEVQKRALKKGVFAHPKYKYTLCDNQDLSSVRKIFISTPALDYETDLSTCPLRYSTEYFREKRENADDKDMFEAVYQQNPQEPEELIFAYGRLLTYMKLPTEYTDYETMAFIDPVREGNDFFSMPILRRYKIEENWTKWYVIDCIYKQQTNDYCLPYVVQKIINHEISWVGYEKNVDLSYTKLIKQELFKNNFSTKIKPIYTTQNKQIKISTCRNGIKFDIVYPAQGMYSSKSELGQGMMHLTTWQFAGSIKKTHDDFPDSLSMFLLYNPITAKNKIRNSFQVMERPF